MSNRDDQDAKLIGGAFHDDWADGPAAAFARAAAASARRRRALRRTLRGATMAVALGAVAFVALRQPPPPQVRTIIPPSVARGYEIISDDELLAQLRDRPLLVVKKENGEKEFVLLAHEEEPPNGD